MAQTKPARAPRKRPGGANISPEGRAKLSELARKRHANGELDAKANGALGGRGNTREKRRAAQALAEHLRDPAMVEAMKAVLVDGLDDEQAIGTRLKTLEIATKIEQDEAKQSLAEERASSQQMDREELLAALRTGLSKGRMRALLAAQAQLEEPIVDADIVTEEEDEGEA
jgi:hypothetical protein